MEEQIRKSVARVLHDDIGQNITSSQIQSMLAERLASNDYSKQAASTVQSLAMRIHQSTRQLVKQLRPHILDDLRLEHAIRQLVQEMRFAEQGMTVRLNMGSIRKAGRYHASHSVSDCAGIAEQHLQTCQSHPRTHQPISGK